MPQQLKLFVNYRRADEATFVELLRTHFMFRYGRENVFMDFDSIPPFTRFEDFIKQKVRECDVIVPIIGGRWLELLKAKAASGGTDFVRIELEEALRLGKVIAPVCIQGAGVPPLDQVPAELHALFGLNIPSISGGRDLLNNVGWLMDNFERALADRGVQRTAANADTQAVIEESQTLSMDDLMDRFIEAVQKEDFPQALIWAAEMRSAGSVPGFFRLDEREGVIQARLKAAEEARRRREVVEYLYKFVRRMKQLNDAPDYIRAALAEIWAIEKDYDPDRIAAGLPKPPAETPPPAPTPQRASAPPRPRSKILDILPRPFEWIDIPAGKVTLEQGGYLNASQTFDVPTFTIAKYPITNAQFAKFIEASGYVQKRWWTEAGWDAKAKGMDWNGKEWAETGKAWTQPRYWTDAKWNGAEHPVVGVSWYEAVAFSRWLSETSGESILLPTEQQWQRAAQGDKGLTYPWGNDFDSARCNTRESNLGKTTSVTQYAGKGDSPFGVTDMSGNVWEWCLTDYYSGDIELKGTDVRVLRGGSWGDGPQYARAAFLVRVAPDGRLNYYGFRVVVGSVPI